MMITETTNTMRKKLITPFLLSLGLTALCLTSGFCQGNSRTRANKAAATAKQIRWFTSPVAAANESKRSGKPILVDFYADWCPPCQKMKKTTFTNPQVIAESTKWVMAKINVDQQPEVAAYYGISGLPTIGILKSDGTLLTGTSGYLSATELITLMRSTYQAALQ